ncbi:glycosyltransferase family 2 protein [Panacibacter ginsenosidivorans]|uniref:Glycosyltransferase family 2 protein n=1 Tax=Panacibacter ginsenosidivorans TaxID=1813871 RepID=A0A5B8VGD7_9BACT|nr:glycosyltransferase family 2 protein [Panacibacter ginsenosidivorans]
MDLTISVVLYKNPHWEIEKLISCIIQTGLNYKLFLIDNSPTDFLRIFALTKNTEYFFNNRNVGFGKGQNIAIDKALGQSKYHLILNPDISFNNGTLENIYTFMEQHQDVGQVMPKICYQDGSNQKLCKLLPHPIDLIGRRFFYNLYSLSKRSKAYELNGFTYDKMLDTPALSGCFMFVRTAVLKDVRGFDTRYFMYMEDIDLTRRISRISKTVFYPGAIVIHAFNRGSYSNPILLKYHIISAIKYFYKWGWFCDSERAVLNKKILLQLQG